MMQSQSNCFEVLAAIDVGSNTIKMTVAQSDGAGGLIELHHDADTVRLGAGIAVGTALDPARAERALTALARFADDARALGASRLFGVATEALRLASDGQAFVEEAEAQTGWSLDIITGTEEASLTFAGLRDFVQSDERTLIADIGGGSTEVIWTHHGNLSEARSLPIGSGRLTDQWIHTDPPSQAEFTACSEAVAGLLQANLQERTSPGQQIDRIIVSGGTGVYLGVLLGQNLDIDVAALQRAVTILTSCPSGDLAVHLGIPLERARVLLAGVATVCSLAEWFSPAPIDVVESGLRRGLLAREFAHVHDKPTS